MIDGYDNRMLSAPRFVREGHRLIPIDALVRTKPVEAQDTETPATDPR